MKVKELIAKLQKFNQELPVWVIGGNEKDGPSNIEKISWIEDISKENTHIEIEGGL